MTECYLGETSNRQFIMKVASHFFEYFSLVFISFGFKLHNAAQGNIMQSTCCIIVTGMVPFKILKILFYLLLFQQEFANLLLPLFS